MKRFITAVAVALAALSLSEGRAAARNPAEVVRLTNIERQRYGLRPLQTCPVLTSAAAGHANAMARSGSMSHTLGGSTLPSRLNQAGYRFSAAAENIAHGQTSAQGVVSSWMTSPGHRGNILSASYTQVGVGVRVGGDGRPFYCQVFGRR